MKAKDLIKILEQYPEDEIFSHLAYDDCFTPLVKRGKTGKDKHVLIIYCEPNGNHISDDYVDFSNAT
jgi:hypothetical protein